MDLLGFTNFMFYYCFNTCSMYVASYCTYMSHTSVENKHRDFLASWLSRPAGRVYLSVWWKQIGCTQERHHAGACSVAVSIAERSNGGLLNAARGVGRRPAPSCGLTWVSYRASRRSLPIPTQILLRVNQSVRHRLPFNCIAEVPPRGGA